MNAVNELYKAGQNNKVKNIGGKDFTYISKPSAHMIQIILDII